jgi:hypothetical protein
MSTLWQITQHLSFFCRCQEIFLLSVIYDLISDPSGRTPNQVESKPDPASSGPYVEKEMGAISCSA